MSPRWSSLALLILAAAALGLRLFALLGTGGPLAIPSGYDDSVYFAASALLFKGVLPYRDYVFVHPPGVLYFYGIVSALIGWIDAARAFALARVLATVVGALNVWLVGRVALRAAGPFAGVMAAALYAIDPDAISAERGPYLEAVLNLACLSSALVWLGGREDDRRRPLVAGALCGAACATKVLGGIWLLAALVSTPRKRLRFDIPPFLAAAATTGLLLVAPLALTAPRAMVMQTLMFHAWRPPDGILDPMTRVLTMFGGAHRASSILAAVAVVSMIVRLIRRSAVSRPERYFAFVVTLTVLAFLASSSYWSEYNSHLAPSRSVLAGLGAAALLQGGRWRRALSATVVACVVGALTIPSLRQTMSNARTRAPEVLVAGGAIRRHVPPSDCVFAFDPSWTLAGGRLPPYGDGAPIIVDSYGAMLLRALQSGQRFAHTTAAFQTAEAQGDARARLEACRFAIIGGRGRWQLDQATRAWVDASYFCQTPAAGELCLWERMLSPDSGLAIAAGVVEFGEGWYSEEGSAPHSWRWMSSRSVTRLPVLSGPARLQLQMQVPFDPATPPTIAIELDGRVLERFVAREASVARAYDVQSTSVAPHTLVLITNRTENPSRSGSSDTRELGLRLNRLIWLERDGPSPGLRPPSPRSAGRGP